MPCPLFSPAASFLTQTQKCKQKHLHLDLMAEVLTFRTYLVLFEQASAMTSLFVHEVRSYICVTSCRFLYISLLWCTDGFSILDNNIYFTEGGSASILARNTSDVLAKHT